MFLVLLGTCGGDLSSMNRRFTRVSKIDSFAGVGSAEGKINEEMSFLRFEF